MKNFFFLLIALLFLSKPAQCQWGTQVGENVQLTSGDGIKSNVLIEPGPDDSWFISYTVGTAPNYNVVHLSRVDNVGIILWDIIIHDLSTAGSPRAVMVPDMSDGVIMAWIDRRISTDPMVFSNRIDLDGNKLWGATDLQVGMTDGQQSCPRMISDGQGGAIVTCRDENPGNGDFTGIYAHGIGSAGLVSWRTFLFPSVNDCNTYSISTDGENGLIAFTVYGHILEMENQIRGMRLDENGNKVWLDETIELGISLPIGMKFLGSPDGYTFPKITFDPLAGVYLVYFYDPLDGSASVHRGQLIDIDANQLWATEGVLLNAPSPNSPEVNLLTDLDGNLYFNYHTDSAWELQKVLVDGTLPWTIDGVEYSSAFQGSPDNLEITMCNDVMVSVDGLNGIINAVRIDENGDMVYNPPLLPLSVIDLDYGHRDPVIRVNENDRVIVVWAIDDNISEWQLKMHGFHKNGMLGNVSSVDNLQHIDIQIYPNPISKQDFLTVQTTNIKFGKVSLIDATGKRIMAKSNIDFRSGDTRISLPNELKAGIYFIQITEDNKQFSGKLTVY